MSRSAGRMPHQQARQLRRLGGRARDRVELARRSVAGGRASAGPAAGSGAWRPGTGRSGPSVRSKAASAPGTAASVGSSSRTEAASSASWSASAPAVRLRFSTSGAELALAVGQRAGHPRGARHQPRQVAWLLAPAPPRPPRPGRAARARPRSAVCRSEAARAALRARRELRQRRSSGPRAWACRRWRGSRRTGPGRAVWLSGITPPSSSSGADGLPGSSATVNPPSRNSRGRIRSRASRCTGRPSSVDLELEHGGVARPLRDPADLAHVHARDAHRRALAELVRARRPPPRSRTSSRRGAAW